LVIILGFLICRLPVLLTTTGVAKRPLEVIAIDGRVVGTWMPWALLLQELLELPFFLSTSQQQGTNKDA
jgi:hypothetical protein